MCGKCGTTRISGCVHWISRSGHITGFEGTFVGDPRHGRVGRGIRSEDGPELKDKLRTICGLIMEAVG